MMLNNVDLANEQGSKSMVSASAVNRFTAACPSTFEKLPGLSSKATKTFQQFILQPLLGKSSLKDFHPLVADCPRRIKEKEIVCLRDLEKTLMFMAPVSDIHNNSAAVKAFTHWLSSKLQDNAATAKLYVDFCIESIRCIQATVEHLGDRELTRPNDRPYTSGYFIDLVDQIRNYAHSLQTGEKSGDNESVAADADSKEYVSHHPATTSLAAYGQYSLGEGIQYRYTESRETVLLEPYVGVVFKDPLANYLRLRSEQIRLYGGLNKNGRPAELVRITKDGKAFSLASGEEIPMADIEEDERRLNGLKRSLTADADDESILRSMARRKASATEMTPKVCREAGCGKHFKRACDLTKHEKTHSRPWKCHDTSCRYHEYGWPTEKELDRHNNDKHAANPKLYKCLYTPCPYSSKRESNCKQHMEKSHGWTYVRSKNNGKNRGLPTPQDTNLQTPVTDHHPSPQQSIFGGFEQTGSMNGDIFNDGHSVGASSYNPDVHYSNDMVMTEPQQFISPADSNLQLTSNESSPYFNNYQEFPPANNATLNFGGNGNDFTLYEDLYNAAAFVPQPQIPQFHQQPSPDQSIFTGSYKSPAPVQSWDMAPLMSNNTMPHLSPIGQGNCDTMLYTPASMMDVDDSFEFASGDDFPLFSNTSVPAPAQNMSLFGEIPSNATGMSQMQSQVQWDEFYNTAAFIQPYEDEALGMLKFEN